MLGICWRSLNVCSKCLLYPHQQLGETKVCAEWIPHVLMHVLLVTICLQCWRNENNAVLDRILMIDESRIHSFDPQLKRQNVDWHSQRGRKLHSAVRMLLKSCTSCSLAAILANITVHSCRMRRGRLFTVNNLNHLSMVSFCCRIMQHSIAIVMCKICCHFGAGRCWNILPTLQISSHVFG